ncbi:MAG: glycoside hydrolase family 31 protein [Melioribacteraceae bacterium]|nr:glycoside hydrolase family 31 protein [Melioribacteraceae bacterium]
MKKYLLILIMISAMNSKAQFQFAGEIVNHYTQSEFIELKLSNGLFRVYLIDDNLIRFRFISGNEFDQAPSYAVTENISYKTIRLKEDNDYYYFSTSELYIKIRKNPCRVVIEDKNGNVINEDEKSFGMAYEGEDIRCFKKLFKDELFYGLGEKAGNLSRNGSEYTMWNTDHPAFTKTDDPLYQSIPFFIGVRNFKAYGIFLDNTFKSRFNMGASNDRFYWFGAEKGELDYYFIWGPEIKRVISSYTALTGRMTLPPKWALGYQQCKWSYYPESTVRNLANEFRSREIPCDVIYLDIHYMNGYRVFSWDEERFPDPVKMIDDLGKKGFKIITIVDPAVKADIKTEYEIARDGIEKVVFAKYPDGELFLGEVWPSWSYFPDFSKVTTREWWGKLNAGWLTQGIAGIWNDMNEPAIWGQAFPDIVEFDDNGFGANHKKIHNIYALAMAKSTFDGIRKYHPNKRPFILTRAGFSGIQKYAAVWTGDNIANEEHLQLACTMLQSMSLSGLPFVGSDVGGFFEEPSENLYARWIQMGALTPFFRGHTIINTKDQEPWAFGEYVESIAKSAIRLRYSLLPYIYNEFRNSSITGLPVMRPMFLEFQNDSECYKTEANFQYMFGSSMLVAPVIDEKAEFKKLYLPEGRWFDWWSGEVVEGGDWIIVDAPIWKLPIYIREGGVIPLQKAQNYVGEMPVEELAFKILPADEAVYSLYEDDGSTMQFTNNSFSLTEITLNDDGEKVSLYLNTEMKEYQLPYSSYIFELYNMKNILSITMEMNDEVIKLTEDRNGTNSYKYDPEKNVVIIKTDYSDDMKIIINRIND